MRKTYTSQESNSKEDQIFVRLVKTGLRDEFGISTKIVVKALNLSLEGNYYEKILVELCLEWMHLGTKSF